MPTEITNQITNTFNAIGVTVIETLLIYFVLPFFGAVVICRFVFKVKGNLLRVIWYLAALASLYLFVAKGLPHMQSIYSAMAGK